MKTFAEYLDAVCSRIVKLQEDKDNKTKVEVNRLLTELEKALDDDLDNISLETRRYVFIRVETPSLDACTIACEKLKELGFSPETDTSTFNGKKTYKIGICIRA